MPSYTEGCPIVVLEAMLCKTPIIASSVGAIPELLSDECGLLVERKNVNDLTEKIDYLLKNPELQERLIKNAYKLFFSISSTYSPKIPFIQQNKHNLLSLKLKLKYLLNNGISVLKA